MKAKKVEEGWGWPSNSRKAHYFVDGRSLCRRWAALWTLDEQDQPQSMGAQPGRDDCTTCWRAAVLRKAESGDEG